MSDIVEAMRVLAAAFPNSPCKKAADEIEFQAKLITAIKKISKRRYEVIVTLRARVAELEATLAKAIDQGKIDAQHIATLEEDLRVDLLSLTRSHDAALEEAWEQAIK